MTEQLLERLLRSPRKRVSLEELRRTFLELRPELQSSPDRNKLLLEALQGLEAERRITFPAAGSWEKFGNPAMPKWIQLVRESAPLQDYSHVAWVPELGFWTELKPAALASAVPINDFLLKRRSNLTPVPIKERSLEIFGDEKRLDALRSSADNSLFGGRLPLSTLGAFVVPSPLPYRVADAAGRQVLVVENHNSFWSFGEWNQQAKRYAAVVYGSGNAFQGSGDALEQVLKEVGGVGAEYLGDLDPAGVRIPLDFNRARHSVGGLVGPAVTLYSWLLINGRRRPLETLGSGWQDLAIEWLGTELGTGVAKLWDDGFWIPQESLGFEQLNQNAVA